MNDFQISKSTKINRKKLIRISNLLIDYLLSNKFSYSQALLNHFEFTMETACLRSQPWIPLKKEDYKLAIDFVSKALLKDDKFNKELTITTLNYLTGAYSKSKKLS
ncbi:unnamed protein product [Rotaria sp. Silwood1]|nr:unnamed protein product [Rotaria sp. Silwood1]CAF1539049.1 unnamed protein product [Rotaria sp. Silwood1]